MQQIHGPYRLTAGQHVQDDPSGVAFVVQQCLPSFLVAEDGKKWPISQTTFVQHDGRQHSLWRGGVRVTPDVLTPGDGVELCHETTYGPPDLPANLRQRHVTYETFMSDLPLHELNSPNAIKYLRATDVAQATEIEQLRREKADLLQRLEAATRPGAQDTGKIDEDAAPLPKQHGKRQMQPA